MSDDAEAAGVDQTRLARMPQILPPTDRQAEAGPTKKPEEP